MPIRQEHPSATELVSSARTAPHPPGRPLATVLRMEVRTQSTLRVRMDRPTRRWAHRTRGLPARLPGLLALAILSWCGLWFAPRTAHAWTEASVRSVHLALRLDPASGGTRYELEAEVRVRRGWLEGIAIEGFEEPIRWTEPAPTLHRLPPEEGAETAPRPATTRLLWPLRAERAGARWWLRLEGPRFRRPRRGRYRLRAVWFGPPVAGSHATDRAGRYAWTLPPWRAGLEDVHIAIALPPGAEAEAPDVPGGSLDQRTEEDVHWVVWRRSQLPRATPWTVRWRLRTGGGTQQAEDPRTDRPERSLASSSPRTAGPGSSVRRWSPARAAAALLVLQWWGGALWLRRRRLRPRAWLPWPRRETVRGVIVTLLGAWAWLGGGWAPEVGVALALLLAWRRPPDLSLRPAAGWRPLHRREARRLSALALLWRLAGLGPWDPSRPLGASAWLAVSMGMVVARGDIGSDVQSLVSWLLWGLAPWADVASRHPSPVAIRWAILRRLVAHPDRRTWTWRPVALVDRHGRVHEVRLRTDDEEKRRARGLNRLELNVMDARTASARHPVPGVLLWPTGNEADAPDHAPPVVKPLLHPAERLPWPDHAGSPWWTPDLDAVLHHPRHHARRTGTHLRPSGARGAAPPLTEGRAPKAARSLGHEWSARHGDGRHGVTVTQPPPARRPASASSRRRVSPSFLEAVRRTIRSASGP